MERQIDFKKIMKDISVKLHTMPYDNGDISDIGNEIGLAVGYYIENMTQEEINDLISGIRHGISLTNGTHWVMKTELEITQKYIEMLKHTEMLQNISKNPPDNMSITEVVELNDELNFQYRMNNIMEWVLNTNRNKIWHR